MKKCSHVMFAYSVVSSPDVAICALLSLSKHASSVFLAQIAHLLLERWFCSQLTDLCKSIAVCFAAFQVWLKSAITVSVDAGSLQDPVISKLKHAGKRRVLLACLQTSLVWCSTACHCVSGCCCCCYVSVFEIIPWMLQL